MLGRAEGQVPQRRGRDGRNVLGDTLAGLGTRGMDGVLEAHAGGLRELRKVHVRL